jgi:hypothetical protein
MRMSIDSLMELPTCLLLIVSMSCPAPSIKQKVGGLQIQSFLLLLKVITRLIDFATCKLRAECQLYMHKSRKFSIYKKNIIKLWLSNLPICTFRLQAGCCHTLDTSSRRTLIIKFPKINSITLRFAKLFYFYLKISI